MGLRNTLLIGSVLAVTSSATLAQQASPGVSTGAVPPPPITGPRTPPPKPAPAPAGLPKPGEPVPAPSPEFDPNSPATLPYEALIKIAQTDANQPKDATVYTLKISSKRGTPPSLIELHLERKTGPQKLQIDQFGFFQVPFNEELVAENPNLISNQPKGSLNLQVKLALDKPDWPKPVNGTVTYQQLFSPMLKLNEQMKAVDPLFGEPDQQQFAIRIKAAPGATLKITRNYGTRTLGADEQGHIWLVFEKLLFDENSKIQVPESCQFGALPVTPQQAMAIRSQ